MYMSAAALGGRLAGGKPWVGLDLSQAAGRLGVNLSSLTDGQADPRTSLAQLREAGSVVEVGPTTVGGVRLTRYSVLLDLGKGLDKLEGAQREALQQLLDRLQSTGGRYGPADVWVDGDGYLRRFSMSVSNYLGTGTSFSLAMDLHGFGDPVRIAVPPPSQVADLTGLLSSGAGG